MRNKSEYDICDLYSIYSCHPFRIPADGHWEEAISPHVLNRLGPLDQISGMICTEHFTEADILPATKSQPIRLKKGAVPTIFKPFKPTEQQIEHIANIEVIDVPSRPSLSSASSLCDPSDRPDPECLPHLPDHCENCQYLEVNNRELKQIHLIEKTNSELS